LEAVISRYHANALTTAQVLGKRRLITAHTLSSHADIEIGQPAVK
jgi:hypothetical protein